MHEQEQQRVRRERRLVEQWSAVRAEQVAEQIGARRGASGHLRRRGCVRDRQDGFGDTEAHEIHHAAIQLGEHACFERFGVTIERLHGLDEGVVLQQAIREVHRRELLAALCGLVIRDVQHDLHLRRERVEERPVLALVASPAQSLPADGGQRCASEQQILDHEHRVP